ncbi:MAG: tetratricopeptide repeat protein [Acidobacteriota bacterium]|nr:tetratricopeptide repeat protein [Acidobacteriota bacterium]
MPGKARGSVYAFPEELSRWLQSAPLSSPGEVGDELSGLEPPGEFEADAPAFVRWPRWLLAAVLVVLLLAAVWGVRRVREHSRPGEPGSAANSIRDKVSADPQAEDLYLKGRYEWNKRTPESLNRAVELFNQAIARDPRFAQAYAGLAESYNLLREYSSMPAPEAYSNSLTAARQALELDPSLPEAHRALAFALFNWEWDLPGSEREFRRALELNPSDAVAHHWYATSLLMSGRTADALSQIELARQLDPSSAAIAADRALILARNGQRGEAMKLLRQIETTDPNFRSPHWYLACLGLDAGDIPEYLREAKVAAGLSRNATQLDILNQEEKAYRQGGEAAMWQATLKVQKDLYARDRMDAYDLAVTCERGKDRAGAMHYLTLSFEQHDPRFIGVLSEEPFTGMRGDAAFRSLLKRAHLPLP